MGGFSIWDQWICFSFDLERFGNSGFQFRTISLRYICFHSIRDLAPDDWFPLERFRFSGFAFNWFRAIWPQWDDFAYGDFAFNSIWSDSAWIYFSRGNAAGSRSQTFPLVWGCWSSQRALIIHQSLPCVSGPPFEVENNTTPRSITDRNESIFFFREEMQRAPEVRPFP